MGADAHLRELCIESSLQLEFVVVDEVDGSRMTLGEKEEATGARVAAGSQDV